MAELADSKGFGPTASSFWQEEKKDKAAMVITNGTKQCQHGVFEFMFNLFKLISITKLSNLYESPMPKVNKFSKFFVFLSLIKLNY